MIRQRWRMAVVVLFSSALACADEPGAPVPGTLEVVVAERGPAIGALLFLVEGGPVDTVAAPTAAGLYLDAAAYSGVAVQVLVVGDRLQGVVARVRVPDLRAPYSVALQQVADSASFALRPPEQTRIFLRSGWP